MEQYEKEQASYAAGMRKGWDEAIEYLEQIEEIRRKMQTRRKELEAL